MKLYYLPGNNDRLKTEILDIIKHHVPEHMIAVQPSIDRFSEQLRQFHDEPVMAVIVMTTKSELMNILRLKDMLTDIPTVLILPDQEKETISKGTLLHPRFISFIRNDFTELKSVIEKMVERYCS